MMVKADRNLVHRWYILNYYEKITKKKKKKPMYMYLNTSQN